RRKRLGSGVRERRAARRARGANAGGPCPTTRYRPEIVQSQGRRPLEVATEKGEYRDESGPVLWRPGNPAPRLLREHTETHGPHRIPADPLASDEVLRSFRSSRVHPVPRIPRGRDQAVLPELRRVSLE